MDLGWTLGVKRLSEPAVVNALMGFLRLLHVLKSSTVTFCSVLRRTLLDIVVRKETSVTLPGRFFFLSEVILSYVVNFSFIKNQLTTELSFTQLMQN